MTTEEAIRLRWGSYGPLTEVVPLTRLYTDEFPTNDPPRPYVVMRLEGMTPSFYSSDDSGYLEIHRFNVWDEIYSRGDALWRTIRDRFNRCEMDADDKVLNFQFANINRMREEDGMWRWMVGFNAQIREVA